MNQSFLIAGVVDDLPPVQRALVLTTLDRLYEADPTILRHVLGRVLPPIPDGPDGDAAEARLIDADGALQPFAELVLLEVRAVAAAPGWSLSMKRDRALTALALAGF